MNAKWKAYFMVVIQKLNLGYWLNYFETLLRVSCGLENLIYWLIYNIIISKLIETQDCVYIILIYYVKF